MNNNNNHHVLVNIDQCLQPPQVMSKLLNSDDYLWAFDVWHTNLLPALRQHHHEEHEVEEAEVDKKEVSPGERRIFGMLWGSRSPSQPHASGF